MRLILALILFPVFAVGQSSGSFRLKGELDLDKKVDKVYLSYRNGDEAVNDSFQLKGDDFTYNGTLAEPVLASLRVKYLPDAAGEKPSMETIPVFLQKGKIKIKAEDSLSNYKVKGSVAHRDYILLQEETKPYSEKLNALYKDYNMHRKEKNQEGMQATEKSIDSLDELMREEIYASFVRKNPASPIAFFALRQYAGYDINAEKAEPLFMLLPETVRSTPSALSFREQLDIARKTGIGQYAMDFTQNDTLGNPVALSSFRGKYVLVDFWASWCGPCRVENPNVVKVFNRFKDQGFTVLGVSLDRPNGKEKWLKAIHDDRLTWTHVSDLKFWDNEVAKQYGIRAIPQNILVDPQGRIVAKNLRGEELEQKVGELMERKSM